MERRFGIYKEYIIDKNEDESRQYFLNKSILSINTNMLTISLDFDENDFNQHFVQDTVDDLVWRNKGRRHEHNEGDEIYEYDINLVKTGESFGSIIRKTRFSYLDFALKRCAQAFFDIILVDRTDKADCINDCFKYIYRDEDSDLHKFAESSLCVTDVVYHESYCIYSHRYRNNLNDIIEII